jgi:1,4-dihydroxy-2-naphthoate octaprenyltransferase
MAAIKHYLGIIRAPFLLLSVTLVASGAAAAAYEGAFSWTRTVVALIGLVALHAAVDALNEASDMRSGIDLRTRRTPFSGGSGILPAGHLTERTAWIVGYVAFAIGFVCGVWFLFQVGWVLLPILLAGAVCVLAYTDFLARIGVGEIAAGLGLGALPVMGTALVQDGTLGPAAVAASVPAFFMTFNLLLLNEFPDEEADRAGGRRNLVLILGRKMAAWIYALAALSPSLLLTQPLRWALGSPQEPVPFAALGANVAWNHFTNIALAATLILARSL